jgi:hypothetical protein
MRENPRVEQVGYLQGDTFQMMGDELSINGLLAAAYLLNKSGQINNLNFDVLDSTVSLTFPCSLVSNIDKSSKIVKLDGITYQIITGFPTSQSISNRAKTLLKQLTSDSPASGLIYCRGNQIQPLVYVKATNSYVWENACGSGSLAASLITGKREIIQPSGQTISFKINSQNIVVTTSAKEV